MIVTPNHSLSANYCKLMSKDVWDDHLTCHIHLSTVCKHHILHHVLAIPASSCNSSQQPERGPGEMAYKQSDPNPLTLYLPSSTSSNVEHLLLLANLPMLQLLGSSASGSSSWCTSSTVSHTLSGSQASSNSMRSPSLFLRPKGLAAATPATCRNTDEKYEQQREQQD